MENWGGSRSHHTYVDPDYLTSLYEISESDLQLIRDFKPVFMEHMDEMVEEWYAWLKTMPEFDQFFSDEETLSRVQGMQRAYWEVFMDGVVDDDYVDRRHLVGEAHARIGLPLNTYFAGMSRFLTLFEKMMVNADMNAEAHPAEVLAELG